MNIMNITEKDELLTYLKLALPDLSVQDLSRLVPYIQEKNYQSGEKIFAEDSPADTLYFIIEGEIQVVLDGRQVCKVNEGFLGEESILEHPVYFYKSTAASETTKLLTIDGSEINKIISNYPTLKQEFSFSLLRFGLNKKIVKPPKKSYKFSKQIELKKFIGWLLTFLIPIGLYNLPWFTDIPPNTRIFIAIFATTIVMWVFKLVPDYIAGLLPILVVLILGITPSSVILGGFQSSSLFMAMSIFVLSAVVVSSGLVYRILLILLKYIPPSNFLYNLMMTIFGLSLTPIMPSTNGRVGLTTPLLTDLIASLRYKPQSTDANRLAISTFFGISIFSAVFMTSKSINFVVFGMLPTQIQDSFQWLNWALAASVAGLVSLGLFLLLLTIVYPSQQKPKLHRHHVESQLKILGPLSIAEWGAIIGILILIAGIVTTSMHKIKPAWIGLALMFLFLAMETMPKDDFRKKIDWPFLFLLGTLIGLAKAISFLGIDQMISLHLSGLAGLMKENLYLFVLALAAIIFVIRFAVSINATVVIVASIFLPLSESAGINVWVMGFMILTLSESFILPYQCSYYVMFQSLNEKHNLYLESAFLKFNIWGFIIRILSIYASIPFWKTLEIL
ncbi:SLC13 family permease [Candidatus Halobeggiatoa sp. HSG11]|nr:SLC13 family permease [Candidatus Halobeggiatoa sp. HSG11]